ncbi:glycosyltransferase family A protein [Mesorhizobium sp. CN2-181]|uniref:glycosyltransferase family 2 protein n=1 Tax=Mesorhizobium yinganensis TaxID=3157707 RepID=UPI0032B7C6EB
MHPDLSLVVVCYEMARELPRTLISLSPAYQRGVSSGNYEVIVVDNGSAEPPEAKQFADLGLTLRVLRCSSGSPSPVIALNEGLAAARGNVVGAWIDGARLASPGLLHAATMAASLHPRPIVATTNYQLGFQRQHLSAAEGYDREREDELLRSIGWPGDGYRLFEVATPEMKDPPFGPMLESNALFMPKSLWNELGGYDPAFTEPGGGMANPDTLARACALPATQLIRVTGEGTFHQIHGGMTTSSAALALRTLDQGSRFYLRLRGQPLKPVRKLGWVFDASKNAILSSDGPSEAVMGAGGR